MTRMYVILRNPYYIGLVPFKGRLDQGRHTPLVKPETLDRVQAVLDARDKTCENQRKHHHYLKSSLVCG